MQDLTKRQKTVLRCVVRCFIETATPVGSENLVRRYRLGYSAATIRNEMMALERMGYLSQPYPSAGRVPSEAGYRVYVNHLMRQGPLSEEERRCIEEGIRKAEGDIRRILEEAARLLGAISKELSVVVTPWVSHAIFDRIELIGLTENKVLAVIRVIRRQAKTLILTIDSSLSQEDLDRTAAILNERLSGLRLDEIQATLAERIKDAPGNPKVLRQVVSHAEALFDFSHPLDIHTSGTQNILSQPEFSDQRMVQRLFALLDDREELLAVMKERCPRLEVLIGEDIPSEQLRPFSLIKTSYRVGQEEGTLGVIGPTRMPYGRIVPLVAHMAETMSRHLSP